MVHRVRRDFATSSLRPLVRRATKRLRAAIFLMICSFFIFSLDNSISAGMPQDAPAQKPIGILLAAGDITRCSSGRKDGATADLIKAVITENKDIPIRILPLGDLAYPRGSVASFKCYDDHWGQDSWIPLALPAIGNHDRETDHGEPFFAFFRKRGNSLLDANGKNAGYYAVNFPDAQKGPWKLIALDYLKTASDGDQMTWLEGELGAAVPPCLLAFSHVHPFSAGRHGHCKKVSGKLKCYSNDSDAKLGQDSTAAAAMTIFDKLVAARATLFLAGHDHNFEHQPRKNAKGEADSEHGVRSFVVGTGGSNLTKVDYEDNKGRYILKAFGILKIDLYAERYEWQFKSVDGTTPLSGKDHCNRP